MVLFGFVTPIFSAPLLTAQNLTVALNNEQKTKFSSIEKKY
jgi:hypothetical protein